MPQLSYAQYLFLEKLDTKFQLFLAGMGAGKTYAGCHKLLRFASKYPGTVQGYYAPTYGLIRDIFYPSIEKAAAETGYRLDIKEGKKEVTIRCGRKYYGTIICRSMRDPDSIIGYEHANAHADEIDIFSTDKAIQLFRRIQQRNRLKVEGVDNPISFSGTPEGFKFLYQRFGKNPKARFSYVQTSTYSNIKNLPEDYIQSLLDEYPEELVRAYLLGMFTNLTSGTCLYAFDRRIHKTKEVAKKGDHLRIGMDFNVQHMAACVFVIREGVWCQVDEFTKVFDTPAMITKIHERYPGYSITIYPDATGKNRKSVGASKSDISLLKQEGWSIKAHDSNPLVQDRIISSNKAYQDGKVLVNVDRCPDTVDALEQQNYNENGEPDKSLDVNHPFDAHTYPLVYTFPVKRPVAPIVVGMDS